MNSRDLILGRVRAALRDKPLSPPVPRAYHGKQGAGDLARFIDRLVDYRAHVHRTDDVARVVTSIVGDGALLIPPGLPAAWLAPGVRTVTDDGLPTAKNF